MMLLKLLSGLDRDRFDFVITSLVGMGGLGKRFADLGVPVHCLDMTPGHFGLNKIYKLIKLISEERPDIVQTWLYHSDFIGGISARATRKPQVIWNIRNSNLDPRFSRKTTILTASACARLSSYIPRKIVCCAESAKAIHVEMGYDKSRFVVIPNGFNTDEFKPNPLARAQIRSEFNIPDHFIVFGLAARYDSQKDHASFIAAASRIISRSSNVRFILCGYDIDSANIQLHKEIMESGISDYVHLLGRRDDMDKVTAAFDIACSSSAFGEAFSNTIGEAMSCGVPCVVTDVGDSSLVVGSTGLVVPPRSPELLEKAMMEMVEMSQERRHQMGVSARERICNEYSLEKIINKYENLYLETYEATTMA